MESTCNSHDWERVQHQLRASGLKNAEASRLRSGIHTRGYLPHVKRQGADYFVTFRLADSLPRQVLLKYEAQKANSLREVANEPRKQAEEEIQRDFRRKVERFLDKGAGACHLRRTEVAELVVGALKFFDEQRYVLREWVVMPNHVHVILWPNPNHVLSHILKTWKQFTGLRANRILDLPEGRFWQPESYDHWIRNDAERERIARYIRHNPVKAGLCSKPEDWPWSSASCSADF